MVHLRDGERGLSVQRATRCQHLNESHRRGVYCVWRWRKRWKASAAPSCWPWLAATGLGTRLGRRTPEPWGDDPLPEMVAAVLLRVELPDGREVWWRNGAYIAVRPCD